MRDSEVELATDRIIELGRPRLFRTWYELLATALVAGIEVALGVLALLAVLATTHSELLAGLAFSVGFIALLLGHSELFTEGFLVPVIVVAAKEATWSQLLRFWVGTLVGNLAGGWVGTWLCMAAFPALRPRAIEAGAHFATSEINLQTFCLALLAGSAITLLTRMHNGTDHDVAKVIASIAIAFLIAGLQMSHSVLDSLLIFAGIHAGAGYGYLQWLGWFAWALLGNLVGGIGLTTLLRLVRSQHRIKEWRTTSPRSSSTDAGCA